MITKAVISLNSIVTGVVASLERAQKAQQLELQALSPAIKVK